MSSRKVKINGVMSKFSFNKNKKYKYNKSGNLEEATVINDDDIVMSGSKSSLRRMADIERNISILATKLTTTDGEATDADDDNFGNTVNNNTRFKKEVRFSDDVSIDSSDTLDVNGTLRIDGALSLGSSAASTIDSRIDSKISALVAGAPSALNTLNELAAAIGDNSNYAASITSALAGKLATGGTAVKASKLATARTISLNGDISGSTSFDGSGNVTITTVISDDSHAHTVANIDGLQATINSLTSRIAALEAKLASFTAVSGGVRVAGTISATGDITAYGA